MQQVMDHLGEGRVVSEGEAAGYIASLCYESSDANSPVCLVLESDEMGSGKYVMGFELFEAGARINHLPCARLALPAREIVVAPGFSLATPRHAILARLGPAQVDSASTVLYGRERSWHEPSRSKNAKQGETDEWTETNSLDLEFAGNKLVWLQAWKVTSN
jgi:hypothetical protein